MKVNTFSRSLKRPGLVMPLLLLLAVVLAGCSKKEELDATATPEPSVTATTTPETVQPTATAPLATSIPGNPTRTPDRVATATTSPSPTVRTTPVPVRGTATHIAGAVAFPIEVVNASGVGSLQFEITYDPRVLKFLSVSTGPLAKEALLVSNLVTPGRLKVALVDVSGIDGDGVVLTSLFVPSNQRGVTDLYAEIAEVSDTNLRELAVRVTPGNYAGPDSTYVPLTLHFLK